MNRQAASKNLKIGGYTVSVTIVEGRGQQTILALHGFTGSSQDFAPLWETDAGSGFTWICPDFMGHGKSASPEDDEPYSLKNCLQLIEAARMLARDPMKVCLLGYSMGGRIALHYLAARANVPAYLIGASPGLATEQEREARKEHDNEWIRLLENSRNLPLFCEAWEAQPIIARQRELAEPLRSQLHDRRRSNNPIGLSRSMSNCGTGSLPSLWDQLYRLAHVELIHGADDAKFSRIAQQMKEANPSFGIHSIHGCGHAAHLEDPQAVMQVLGF